MTKDSTEKKGKSKAKAGLESKIPKKNTKRKREDMKEQRVRKYCAIHGWCSHSTDECYSQQRKVTAGTRVPKVRQDKQERIKQEAHAILQRFMNQEKSKSDRNNKDKRKTDLEIKNFEQLSISESDGDDTSIVKTENGGNNEIDVDNDIASVSSSSSGQETDV